MRGLRGLSRLGFASAVLLLGCGPSVGAAGTAGSGGPVSNSLTATTAANAGAGAGSDSTSRTAAAKRRATNSTSAAEFDPQRVTWRGLRYVATKFFLKAETTVRLELADKARAASELQSPPARSGALPVTGRTVVVSLDTEAIGRRSTEEIWLRAADGAALQRIKVRHGSDGYAKLYRFTEAGVAYRRSSPASRDEADAPPARWTKQSTGWFPEPRRIDECAVLAQPAALFYLLSAHRWDQGSTGFEVCIFADKAFSLLKVRPVGRAQLDVSVDGPRGLDRHGRIDTLEVSLEAVPLDPAAVESIEVLGLEGDIRLFLDPKTGVPLRIRGELSSLGTVDADLESIAGPGS